tara:strand:+ start:19306 stop:19512 length:207 start_codon:yes stop_codon:yes gene_type:complete
LDQDVCKYAFYLKLIWRLATITLALVAFAGFPPRNTVIKSKAGGWPAAIICLQLLIVTAISIFYLATR